VHWGSRPRAGAPPRCALSFALAAPGFERGPFFEERYLPFPPLALRVALRAGQAIAYAAQVAEAQHTRGFTGSLTPFTLPLPYAAR